MTAAWMTSAEAAVYARLTVNTIRDAAECGDLGGVKVTPGSTRSQWRFRQADIDAWLERGRVTGQRRPRRRRGAA